MKGGLLDPAIVSFVFTPLVVTVALLLSIWWRQARRCRATLNAPDAPGLLLASAVRRMPDERRDWGAAMMAELARLQHPPTRWRFALGYTRVALFPPRQGGSLHTLRNITMKKITTSLGWIGVAISGKRKAPLLAIVFVCILAACGQRRPFDPAVWQQGNLRVRGSMAEDLIKRKVLLGRPADEARRLLGRPEKEYASALVYHIDMGMPFKDPSRYAFVVHLDADRNVREAQITD